MPFEQALSGSEQLPQIHLGCDDLLAVEISPLFHKMNIFLGRIHLSPSYSSQLGLSEQLEIINMQIMSISLLIFIKFIGYMIEALNILGHPPLKSSSTITIMFIYSLP